MYIRTVIFVVVVAFATHDAINAFNIRDIYFVPSEENYESLLDPLNTPVSNHPRHSTQYNPFVPLVSELDGFVPQADLSRRFVTQAEPMDRLVQRAGLSSSFMSQPNSFSEFGPQADVSRKFMAQTDSLGRLMPQSSNAYQLISQPQNMPTLDRFMSQPNSFSGFGPPADLSSKFMTQTESLGSLMPQGPNMYQLISPQPQNMPTIDRFLPQGVLMRDLMQQPLYDGGPIIILDEVVRKTVSEDDSKQDSNMRTKKSHKHRVDKNKSNVVKQKQRNKAHSKSKELRNKTTRNSEDQTKAKNYEPFKKRTSFVPANLELDEEPKTISEQTRTNLEVDDDNTIDEANNNDPSKRTNNNEINDVEDNETNNQPDEEAQNDPNNEEPSRRASDKTIDENETSVEADEEAQNDKINEEPIKRANEKAINDEEMNEETSKEADEEAQNDNDDPSKRSNLAASNETQDEAEKNTVDNKEPSKRDDDETLNDKDDEVHPKKKRTKF